MPKLLVAAVLLTLAACSQNIEQRMARAAERINAAKPRNVESVRTEGRKLIVHFTGAPSSSPLTNDDIARIATAGLCGLDDVPTMLKQGGSIRVEVGNDFGAAAVDVDHCPNA